jgi:dGTPase
MLQAIRLQTESREHEFLSIYAAKANESKGRVVPQEDDPVRTCFQRDRDRILHSKAFRRLKHKTQVFIDPRGDHYRTRLTHTLEVSQVARTIGRAIRLNEDLIEAIAIGHDLGHPPFGHAGERAIDEALQMIGSASPDRFHHSEQSLRVIDVLEDLNLSEETRLGIDGHSKGRSDLSASDGEPVSTLEAAVVRMSDRIAYLNHDIDDALRSGIIDNVPDEFAGLGTTYKQRLSILVEDIIQQSLNVPSINISPKFLAKMNLLKEWMFDNVYLRYPILYTDIAKAENMLKELLVYYTEPGNLPEGFEGTQGAVDYVSGMTDRFAIETYESIKIPLKWSQL